MTAGRPIPKALRDFYKTSNSCRRRLLLAYFNIPKTASEDTCCDSCNWTLDTLNLPIKRLIDANQHDSALTATTASSRASSSIHTPSLVSEEDHSEFSDSDDYYINTP